MKKSVEKFNLNLSQIKDVSIEFVDILDLKEIQRMQDAFSDATGVASIITHPNGTPITKPSNFCRLCNMVRNTEKGLANCIKSDGILGRDGKINKETGLNMCKSAGLWDTGASIIVDGHHIANWLIGQVRNQDLPEDHILAYAEDIGVDKTEMLSAFQEVPVMSASKFEKISEMLFVFANEISEKAYNNYQLKIQILEREHTNELLHKSEEALFITLQSIGDGVISTDTNGLIMNMNPIAEKLCGWDLVDAKGKPLTEVFRIISSKTHIPVQDPVHKVLEEGQIVGLANHTILLSKDGSEYHISDSAAPIKNKEGVVSGIVLVFSDISETYASEEKVRLSESRYRGLVNMLDAGVVVHAGDTSIVMCNPKACELLGLTEDQLTGKKSFDKGWKFVSEQNITMLVEDYPVNQIIRTRKPLIDFVLGIYRPNKNDIVWATLNGFPVFGTNDEVTEVVISFIDITNRKKAEIALKQNETFLRETQFIAKLGTFNHDVNIDQWESSEILDVILGVASDYEKTYAGWKSLIHPDWVDEVTDYFRWKVKEGKPLYDIKYKIIRKNDGQSRWVHALGRLYYNEQNRLVKVIGTLQDITERKNAKEALRESQEQLKQFAAHLQNVREEERLILAREIHDELGQILIAIKIDLGMIKQKMLKFDTSESAINLLKDHESIMGMVDNTINSARKIMTDLRPEVLYMVGFAEAVKIYSANFQTRYNIECNFVNEVDDLSLNPQHTVALYRIVQESLSNVARHSNAKSVQISLQQHAGKLILKIKDDGIGFDENQKVKQNSYGLIGMKERTFLLDGQLILETQPGKGTCLKIEMTYKKEKQTI